ncbi:ABC transporter ATP-binding protein [Planosporangium thailandense]|uniref:ABC transporter ATP-binding protein n=1 Tax=Planosporangium thailandense TaxID=765197 RepID=A0ABX0Y1F5_9ACTN|nr:ABC transporter ATP-binding protein [Planosporangium thailandense]NJC72194.1 ABC transporter ATP-binding protein [Planosporangium thailandense]
MNGVHTENAVRKDETAVRAVDVWKVYGDGEVRVAALRGVNLELTRGALTVIMGPAGSGKSTLLHCLAGLDPVTGGDVYIDDTPVTALCDRSRVRLRRDRVGFVFQQSNLLTALTVEENILLPLSIIGRAPDRRWFDAVVDTAGVRDLLRHRPGQLSGGQQQRVACARALLPRPRVIFADEPTGDLDARSGAEVLGFLRNAARDFGQTVVIVSRHADVARYADRVLFLSDGQLVSELAAPTTAAVLGTMRVCEPAGAVG